MSVRRSLVVLVCWTLLLGSLTTPAVAGTAGTGAGGPATDITPTAAGTGPAALPGGISRTAALTVVQANNTTVRHRNPDGRNEDGDLGAIRAHLADRMGEIVVDCSRAVGVGEFDPCERLNESYNDTLSAYVEVSRETTTDGGDANAHEFRRARREGREYARTVRRFRETYDDYREARASGNASRARREARELRALADEAERTGGNLTRSLGNVSRGGTDVSSAGRAVNETTANVSRTVDGIERTLFVGTETTARLDTPFGSFLDPLVVTGRVTTANGTAVANASVGLSLVRNRSVERRVRARTRTNATGYYRLVYRPADAPVGTVRAAARLLPAAESPYLPSNATVTPRVEQVDAELTVLTAPVTAAYGDRLRVRVRVTAGDDASERLPVDGLPVTTRVDGFQIGSGRTGSDGRAISDGRFPAAVRVGERRLVVGFEEPDRAIAPVTETVRLDVRETATTIDATVREVSQRRLAVEGTLTTADGRPLARRPVRVTFAGRSLGLLRSDENGSFEGNLTIPAEVLPVDETAERTVRIAYDGSGRNLGSTETTLSVTLPAAESGDGLGGASLALVLAVFVLVAAGGTAALVRRRGAGEERSAPNELDSGGRERSTVDLSSTLEAVRAAMDAGDYDVVTTVGYRAVRRALAGQVGVGPEATHWEFYGACAADGVDPERLEAVRGLTERFERVAFSPDEASRSVAAASLADVERVLGSTDTDGDPGASGSTAASGSPTVDSPSDADRS